MAFPKPAPALPTTNKLSFIFKSILNVCLCSQNYQNLRLLRKKQNEIMLDSELLQTILANGKSAAGA